jgi:hypothetical protein
MYNWQHREATASVGYDVTLRQCRVRGNVNTAGVIQVRVGRSSQPACRACPAVPLCPLCPDLCNFQQPKPWLWLLYATPHGSSIAAPQPPAHHLQSHDPPALFQALLEERFIPGITFLLSAELDHSEKNYKFGFGFSVGD